LFVIRVLSRPRRKSSLSAPADFWNGEVTTDPPGEQVGDLGVPGHGNDCSGHRIAPEGVLASLAAQVAAVLPEVAKQGAPFHETMTVCRIASGGTPRSPS
jgi:hypothetical protein